MRRRRSRRNRRSVVEWVIRGATALTAAGLGFVSVSGSFANAVARIDPARAHELQPGNGRITAALAEQRFTLAPSASNSEVSQLARAALRRDPTAVSALSVLGLQAQLRGDFAQARELFSYSHELSRRELKTHIWAIEEAVTRGDIVGALKHYDMALRTSRKAREILFPVLASAVSEPAVRSHLLETMARESIWGKAFISYMAVAAPDLTAVAAFFSEGSHVGLPVQDADRSRLVNAMMSKGLIAEAWRFYKTFRLDADRSRSRDANFVLIADTPAVFDWTTLNPQGISASIQQAVDNGLFHFNAAPGAAGLVLRQMQLLPPGEYRIDGQSIGIAQPEHSRPYWVLMCRNGRELGRVSLPSSGDEWKSFAGRFTVPSDCPVQTLALVVRGSDAISGVSGQIGSVQLVALP